MKWVFFFALLLSFQSYAGAPRCQDIFVSADEKAPLQAVSKQDDLRAAMATLFGTANGKGRPGIEVWNFNPYANMPITESGSYLEYVPGRHRGITDGVFSGLQFTRNSSISDTPIDSIINPVLMHFKNGASGNSLFDRLQYFSLNAMEKINYIDQKTRATVLDEAKNMQNPIVFFDVYSAASEKEILQKLGKIPANARPDAMFWAYDQLQSGEKSPLIGGTLYRLTTGTAWMIAGQRTAHGLFQTMPLHLEEEKLEKPIDRSQYKYTFEIGRAGGVEPGSVNEAVQASVFYALTQVILTGGSPSEAFVFAFVGDRAHQRLYRQNYGMSEYSKVVGDANARIMAVSLADLIERVDATSFTKDTSKLRLLAEGALSQYQALSLFLQTIHMGNQFWSFTARQKRPVELRLFNNQHLDSWIQEATAKSFGKSADPKIVNEIAKELAFRARESHWRARDNLSIVTPFDSGAGHPQKMLSQEFYSSDIAEIHLPDETSLQSMSVENLIAGTYLKLLQIPKRYHSDNGEPIFKNVLITTRNKKLMEKLMVLMHQLDPQIPEVPLSSLSSNEIYGQMLSVEMIDSIARKFSLERQALPMADESSQAFFAEPGLYNH